MTDGPQQPYNPNQGWTAPPGQQGVPGTPGEQRQVLRGQVVGGPDHQAQQPAWTPPADWSPPQPGQGTRGPAQPQSAPRVAEEPDWSALADEAEAGARRRRLLFIGGGVLAAAAVAGIVAVAVVSSGGSPGPSPTVTAAGPSSEVALPPEPSFSEVSPGPTYGPLDFLSTAAKDTAPLGAGTLFPGKKLDYSGGRSYVKTASKDNRDCADAATGPLAAALTRNGCTRMMRVTYTRGGSAVTVGVAVFKDKASAKKLAKNNKFVRPLNGGGVADFCHAVKCWSKSGAVGRYAYFTISGPKNGSAATGSDTASRQAGQDGFNYAFSRIVQRGRDQADAAMASEAASPAN
ncbi:hypothetical protein [Actinacidiphila glaucinigra]|uniref:hypothetical protein n=1 Tax=Actinacidiphila glaucinigra TaxID=235986 RepID=UPI0029A993B3|nr:hypothetical protein [Streptomyces sp. PA03-3a]